MLEEVVFFFCFAASKKTLILLYKVKLLTTKGKQRFNYYDL